MFVENIVLITYSLLIRRVNSATSHNVEGHVVEGEIASIKDFPHAALLFIDCVFEENSAIMGTCGSSILNQAILITAGNCLCICLPNYSSVTAFVGSNRIMHGTPYLTSGFKVHEEFDPNNFFSNDIALVKLQKFLTFGETVRRVSLRRHPSYKQTAIVAGWGTKDEGNEMLPKYLMRIRQRIWSHKNCKAKLRYEVPKGTICGGEMYASSHVHEDDHGSGLIVGKYILVGVASISFSNVSKGLAVYTETAYFYDWIKKNAKSLYCGED